MSSFCRGCAVAFIVAACLFICSWGVNASGDTEPAPDIQARLDLLAQIQKDLRNEKTEEAAEALDEFARGLTPETALAIIRKVGYKPFEELMAQGGKFRRIALNMSALARRAAFEELTDPEAIRAAVSDFLEDDTIKSGPAYRLLKERVGGFSVRYLLEAWNKSSDFGEKAKIQIALVNMGRRVVPPIIAALDTDDVLRKRMLIEVLSKYGDWRAAAKLREIAADEAMTEATRQAALNACRRIVNKHTGFDAGTLTAARLYTMIAEDYLANRNSRIRNVIPRYCLNEGAKFYTWSLRDGVLVAAETPRFAYNYKMAAALAARALKLDPRGPRAPEIIVCARLAEIVDGQTILDYDEAVDNDILTQVDRDAISSALAAARAGRPAAVALGLRPICGALRLAFKYHLDAAAGECMDVIAALPAASRLDFIPADEKEFDAEDKYGNSLILALETGSRRVRYRAAVTLARIAASKKFVNMDIVPDLLLKAMEETGAVRVLVVHSDAEIRNTLRLGLAALGYDVILAENSAEGIATAMDFPAPDIIIAHNRLDGGTDYFIVALRNNKATSGTPILIVSAGDEKSLEDDKVSFSYKSVKGFIINPSDEETLARQMSALRKVGSWEAGRTNATVRDAADIMSKLNPADTMLDLLPCMDRLIALAQAPKDLAARVSAMTVLGNWCFSGALKPAAVILADAKSPKDLRLAAARTIGLILLGMDETDDETFGILLAALTGKDQAVSAAAAEALASAPLTVEQRSRLPKE